MNGVSTSRPTKRFASLRATSLAVAGAVLVAACGSSSSDADTSDAVETVETVAPPPTTVPEPVETEPAEEVACDSEPVVLTTADGIDFVRTPDACFEGLPDWPYEAQYVEID